MPFGKYKSFAECEKENASKRSPGAYCAAVHKKITGRWPTEGKKRKRI